MSIYEDFQRDAADAAKYVNEDGLVTSRYGPQPKKTWLYLQREFERAIPFTKVGDFATGFTYESTNQTGLDGSGGYWIYNGTVPFTVAPGTVPSEPDYTKVLFNDVNNLLGADQPNQFDEFYSRKLTVSQLSTANFASGTVVEVSDRFNSKYLITSGTADGFGFLPTGNSLIAKFIPNGVPNLLQVGGVADGVTDNNAALESMAQISSTAMISEVDGTFKFSSSPTLPSGFTLLMAGQGSISGVQASDVNGILINGGNIRGVLSFEDMRFLGVKAIAGTIRQNGGKAVTSITRSGSTATVTQPGHGYQTGDPAYLRGADQDEYNVTAEAITVLDPDTYTFPVSGTPASPATGTITAGVPSRWNWIKDNDHEPVGVDDSEDAIASGSSLTINYDKTYTKVISIIPSADEFLSNAVDLNCGPSVGLSFMDIKASAKVTLAARISYNGSGWDVSYGAGQGGAGSSNCEIKDVLFSGGNITINHDWLGGSDVSVTDHTNGGAVIPYRHAIRSVGDTQLIINPINHAGSGFVTTADTSMSFLITKQFGQGIRVDGVGNYDTLELWRGNIWFIGYMQE